MIVHSAKPVDLAVGNGDQVVSGRRLLLALLLMLILSASIGTATWSIAHAINPAWTATVDFVVLVVAEVYMSVLGALSIAFGGLKGLRERLGLHFTSGRDLWLAIGIDALCALAAILTYGLLTPLFGAPIATAVPVLKAATDVTRLPGANLFTLLLIGVRVFLLVPLAEELLFRGALYGWVRRYLRAIPTILLTAVIFGFEHTYPGMPVPRLFFLVPLAFIFGIGVGWIRERTGSTL
ncbi:MAG TPA: CPBP family intramembrane glutamic endopeptidase, partial [Ktedonobacterales bacterium]|nr:CPBP family intramembrane glutamic endopeptidase [Ktedonobacterales bacterium]